MGLTSGKVSADGDGRSPKAGQSPGAADEGLARAALSNFRGLVYRCSNDSGRTFIDASGGALELTGHGPAELTAGAGKEFAALIVNEDRARVWEDAQTAMAQGRAFDLEYRIRTASGEVKWVNDRGSRVALSEGGHAIEGVVVDISRLKRAEAALDERGDCFSLAFNSARDMMVLARVEPGPVFRVVAVNRSYVTAMSAAGFSVSSERMEGRTFEEVRALFGFDDDQWALLLARYAEAVQSGRPLRFEEQTETTAGYYHGDSAITPVVDSSGACRFVLYASTDVSARRRVERELRESADKFAKAFNASPGAMSISEPGGRGFIAVNDNYVRMFGYSREELLGKSLTELGLWDGEEHRSQFLTAFREKGSVRDLEVVRRRRDGSLLTCLLSAEALEIEGRGCIIAALYDITERRRAEQSLRESEERFSKAFRATPDAVFITDRSNGAIVDANEGCARVYGYSRDECLGRTTLELGVWQDPDDRVRFAAALEAGRGSVRNFEVAGRARSGARVTVLVSCETIELAGRPHLVTIAHDITVRKAAEHALRESEARFSTAFRASPGAMIVSDAETRRCVEVNDGFCRMFGRSREETLGRSGLELGLWPDAESWDRFFSLLEHEGAVQDFEVATRNRSGEAVTCLVSARNVDLGGRPHFVTMVQDITARKQAEAGRVALQEQLRQTQKLEALGQLAGGIAHDFNNILTGIVAYTELAQMDAGNPDDVRRHLVAIRKASDRATDLVRQILTFSRQQPQERRPIRLGGVMTEAMTLLRSSIPSTIAIEERLDPAAPIVLADKSQIHQVVMNLGTNAAHAMRGGPGQLLVSLDRIRVGPGGIPGARNLEPGGYARISVTDTGHGISEATLERIFDPFFTTKLPGEGTGLGLAVVHGIVRDHQGAITVRSRPGEGTCFEVYLPEHAAPASDESAVTRELPKGRGERILLVDDEPPIVFASSILLRRLGYTVVAHEDPRKAWQAFAGAPDEFAAVISDMTMPHLTGVELAGRIFDLRPALPVILTSGFSGSWTPEALQTIGVRRLVSKPISAEVLATTLAEVLNDGRA